MMGNGTWQTTRALLGRATAEMGGMGETAKMHGEEINLVETGLMGCEMHHLQVPHVRQQAGEGTMGRGAQEA